MKPCFFITMTSKNRSGILATVTTALAELGGDMLYSSQSSVQGYFTMSVAANFPEHRSPEVIRDHLLDAGRAYQMEVLIRPMQLQENPEVTGSRYFLTVNGQDAPGVVRSISTMLAQEMVEIERSFAVPSGPGTFSMVMIINLPEAADLISLNSDLELFGALNGLRISLQHENDYKAAEFPRIASLGNFVTTEPLM